MKRIVLAAFLAVILPAAVAAQTMQYGGDGHDMMHGSGHGAGPVPEQSGQSAFAAIQEIVTILKADPGTDWSRVDLGALRRHLADMNALVLSAVVRERTVEGGLEIVVDGAGRAGEAARRMVPAHAGVLAKLERWAASATIGDDGAVTLLVTASDEGQTVRIRGLGFFGLMASGGHHQMHHLAIARGEGMPR